MDRLVAWYRLGSSLYWLENGIVGILNILKMSRAEGAGGATGRAARGSKMAMIPFFVVHYGLFWLVHGVFVLTMPLFSGMFAAEFDPFAPGSSTGIEPGAIAFAVVALAISHGLSYWLNFLRGGEYRRISPAQQLFAPYGRLVALHVTIIVGGLAIVATGAPAAAVAVLVALKTVLDMGFHLAEHRTAAAE